MVVTMEYKVEHQGDVRGHRLPAQPRPSVTTFRRFMRDQDVGTKLFKRGNTRGENRSLVAALVSRFS